MPNLKTIYFNLLYLTYFLTKNIGKRIAVNNPVPNPKIFYFLCSFFKFSYYYHSF